MNYIYDYFRRDNEYSALIDGIKGGISPAIVTGVCESARPFFAGALTEDTGKVTLILAADERECEKLCDGLCALGLEAVVYPARDYVFDNIGTYSKEFEQQRIAALYAVLCRTCDVVITTPDAAAQYTIPAKILSERAFTLERGKCASLSDIKKKLIECGYSQCELVEGAGQFAVRGGILDIFTPQNKYPYRIDFFGDEIDLIGEFDIETQRRTENHRSLTVLPCREVITDAESSQRMMAEIDRLLASSKTADKIKETLHRERSDLEAGMQVSFADRFFTLVYDKNECLLDYLGNGILCQIYDTQKVKERKKAFDWTYGENIESLVKNGCCTYKTPVSALMGDEFYARLPAMTVACDIFSSSGRLLPYKAQYTLVAETQSGFGGKQDVMLDELKTTATKDKAVLLLCRTKRSAEIMFEMLAEHGFTVSMLAGKLDKGCVTVGYIDDGAALPFGFSLPKTGLVLLTDRDAAARNTPTRRRSKAGNIHKGERIASYADLSVGDIVVHVNHGIGRYEGVKTLVTEGVTRDYIKIVYADNGILYVPCNQLDMVSKYVCGGDNVKLSKMGSSEWQKAKAKARLAAQDIAKELIRLYAERQQKEGFAFPPDDEMQEEFEAGFEYSETECQMRAAAEIKSDMQQSRPMDRLLCGDVGFGKTEVSLRAAFKCVFSGKQCAILVPTTILAMQHYQTLLARFRGYPVNIAMMSRFVTKAEQSRVINDLAKGAVDIVVGTHRLLQKDVVFDDLGLLIVDEEQRFGVKHKESIKMLAQNTDVLTLTATPIPRTLNMALSGIRDMSVLEEAPTDRMPVQSYVLEHDDAVIDEAIRRELRRGGQVFYLHNNVDSIYSKAAAIAQRFPDSNVAIGHGKMDKEELSDVWSGMVQGEIDILVCTTIIETGVNVPNANTLIIEDADRMGLSQLHQIRGRVGRSSRKAYAYFTYRPEKILSEIATKRLEAIREFTEFGSGFKIAMRDLELRGAGNLLGSEQSGHMEAIGYDLYIKILEDAVNELKGKPTKQEQSCTVDILVDSFIGDDYIDSSKIRMDVYRKIAHIRNTAEYNDLYDELSDRFGDPPRSAQNLMKVSLIRNAASACGFRLIEQRDTQLLLHNDRLDMAAASAVAADSDLRGRVLINAGNAPYIAYRLQKGTDIPEVLSQILKIYAQNHKN